MEIVILICSFSYTSIYIQINEPEVNFIYQDKIIYYIYQLYVTVYKSLIVTKHLWTFRQAIVVSQWR